MRTKAAIASEKIAGRVPARLQARVVEKWLVEGRDAEIPGVRDELQRKWSLANALVGVAILIATLVGYTGEFARPAVAGNLEVTPHQHGKFIAVGVRWNAINWLYGRWSYEIEARAPPLPSRHPA